jgi:hypothetical protein
MSSITQARSSGAVAPQCEALSVSFIRLPPGGGRRWRCWWRSCFAGAVLLLLVLVVLVLLVLLVTLLR